MTDVVRRVTQVTLSHFRGFTGKRVVINTDADLVLLTGPNGHGKSSFLDALQLLLTGHHDHKLDDLISHHHEAEASLEAKTKERRPITVSVSRGKQLSRPDGLPEPRFKGEAIAELEARLCAVFQDRVDRLFDETTAGTTLRDVLEPCPPRLRQAELALDEAIARAQERLDAPETWQGTDPQELAKDLADAAEAFHPPYDMLRQQGLYWPEIQDDDNGLTEVAKGIYRSRTGTDPDRKDLPNTFYNIVLSVLDDLIQSGKIPAGDLGRRKALFEAEINQIHREYPTLDDDLSCFAGGSGEPDLATILETLATQARRWAAISLPDRRLGRVLEEIGRVDPVEASKRFADLDDWLRPRREARAKLDAHQKEMADIELLLKESRTSEDVKRLEALRKEIEEPLRQLRGAWEKQREYLDWSARAEDRARRKADLQEQQRAFQSMKDRIRRVLAPSDEIMTQLRDLCNQVLSRFDMVEGILPLDLSQDEKGDGANDERIRRTYSLKMKDGRTLKHLSTGQKTQAGIALMVAQNLALSSYLTCHVLLFDDASTAYDVTNLTRETVLWRQLAYGHSREDDLQRRQVFLSCHNEEIASHYLNLLVPPRGFSMRLVRFTGWSQEKGPSCEEYDIKPGDDPDPTTSQERRSFIHSLTSEQRAP